MAQSVRCWHCGYDRGGLPREALCPECGRKGMWEENAIDHGALRRHGRRWVVPVIVILLFMVLITLCLWW